jgi:multiple sugar transport system substrate-binding protein
MRLTTLLAGVLFLCACAEQDATTDGAVRITVWHHGGQAAEKRTIEEQVERFHAAQDAVRVHLEFLPERDYDAQVQSAAAAGDLPDLLEFDGPFLANYAWQGVLRPIGDLLPGSTRADLLPSITAQGTWDGKLYAVGTFDSGLALYVRPSLLAAAGVTAPTDPAEAWTIDEFDAALAALAEKDDDGAVLDLKLNYPGEWLTYAFSPVLQSAGADLVTRTSPPRAGGTLDAANAVVAMGRVQAWFDEGLVDPNLDDAAFLAGRVAISWVGHWEFPRYRKAFGDDLALAPLPDFGEGTRTGMGSWVWGVPKSGDHPEAVARFLEFLLRPDEVLAMADANGAVPATRTAIARSPLYGEDGPLRLFVTQLEGGYAVPRPRTPAYPVITSAFQGAFRDIRDGGDVAEALSKAAAEIDRDVEDNRGYPVVK